YRLNIGISKETFRSLFGVHPSRQTASEEGVAADKEYDFTALDRVMPHPIYSRQYWVCVLNPSDETFQQVVRPLLAEACERDVSKHKKRAVRS
ncbi:MAG TPA: DUF6194 family protein, partial [Chloroflexia bacterium]|nr:DUF6194 family protein [Chloroflexia bacterium]